MGFFTNLVDAAIGTIKRVKDRAKVTEVIGFIVGKIPAVVADWISYQGADAEAKVRAAWEEFDNRTGLEGPDIIRNLPTDVEERIFDAIKSLGLELSLWAIGKYGPRPTVKDVQEMADGVVAPLFAWVLPPEKVDAIGPVELGEKRVVASGPVPDKLIAELRSISLNPDAVTNASKWRTVTAACLWNLEGQGNVN